MLSSWMLPSFALEMLMLLCVVAGNSSLLDGSSEKQYGPICHIFDIVACYFHFGYWAFLPFGLILKILWFSKKTWLGIEGLELSI